LFEGYYYDYKQSPSPIMQSQEMGPEKNENELDRSNNEIYEESNNNIYAVVK
jgi:glutathionyl-hydroquinone reductase